MRRAVLSCQRGWNAYNTTHRLASTLPRGVPRRTSARPHTTENTMKRLTLSLTLAAVAMATACSKNTTESTPPTDPVPAEPAPVAAEPAPEPEPAPAEPAPAPEPPAPTKDIVDTATEAGNFTTLLSAIDAAGLKDTLKGPGPFTVFAPSDEAFAKLPKGELDKLLKNKKKLAELLNYHVVSGTAVKSTDITAPQQVKTVAGKELAIDPSAGVKLNGEATVTQADILTTNGVIHVVDTVLQPSKAPKAAKADTAAAK